MTANHARSRSSRTDPYEVRPFEPGDRDDYLELYDRVLSGGDEAWFAWKYGTNPFVDRVPIVVATDGDRVVGAKSAVAMPLRAGDSTVDALQPADTMVHPDHRRRGIFSRMTEFMKERYAAGEPSLFFNFPNEKTLAGGLKHGWAPVDRLPAHYRIQNVDAVASDGVTDGLGPGMSVVNAGIRAYQSVRESLVTVPDDAAVEVREGVAGANLAERYRRAVPNALHAERSERFYGWRFGNPDWSYRTYLADAPGTEVGVVTGRGVEHGQRVVNVVDVVPLAGDDRRCALTVVLREICARNDDADLIAVSGRAIPADLLRGFGFLPDTELPLSAVSSPRSYVTYPLTDDDSWTVNGMDVRRPENWLLTFAEQDTR